MLSAKHLSFISFLIIVLSCRDNQLNRIEKENKISTDSTLIKKVINLDTYSKEIHSKSYVYLWLIGSDTSDLGITFSEGKFDSSISIEFLHTKPLLFKDVMTCLDKIIPRARLDFNLDKLANLNLKQPIFYQDLNNELFNSYKENFGAKLVNYSELNEFLLKSSITSELNNLFKHLNKKVEGYGVEKFELLERKSYSIYLPNTDLTNYPDFSINGHTGIFIRFTNTKKHS